MVPNHLRYAAPISLIQVVQRRMLCADKVCIASDSIRKRHALADMVACRPIGMTETDRNVSCDCVASAIDSKHELF